MVWLVEIARGALYLSVVVGSAFVLTSSVGVVANVIGSIEAGPRPPESRSLPTIHVPSPPIITTPPAFFSAAIAPAAMAASTPIADVPAKVVAGIADPEEYFRVRTGLNVRAEASKSSAVVGVVEAGEIVSSIEADGHWLKVAREGQVLGWVYDRYLEPMPATQ